ncbi:hypothetical protein KSD_23700 [Ktedonobacter sp. SOSP1-85]|nr:hypothetical protein KSD_23700 [Ktedonobacter sp. SOSP1-85]
MNERLWQHYQGLLEQAPTQAQRHCVSCWYKKTSAGPFPADWSSSLCPSCAQQIKQSACPVKLSTSIYLHDAREV